VNLWPDRSQDPTVQNIKLLAEGYKAEFFFANLRPVRSQASPAQNTKLFDAL
jgi:hypothetical protein